jgi:CheY-like chemotaxis protein
LWLTLAAIYWLTLAAITWLTLTRDPTDAEFKPDLVFLDLEMPEMDGYQVLRSLRNTLLEGVPIIACTVHLNEAATIREQGFDGFIAKPLDPKRFSAQMRQILNGERVWEF